jgi:ParB-like chromosome segregation protein Spo0J
MNTEEIISINPHEVKFLIHRDRDPVRFKLLKEAIRSIGVRQPLHVRDISGWPAKDRKIPGGGLYKWEALFGEGRTTALLELHEETQDRRFLQLPAIVKDVPEKAVVSAFLAENLLRRSHAWLDQARLIQADVKNGAGIPEIAAEYHITEAHAAKLLRILAQMSPKIKDQLGDVPLNTAEKLIKLPRGSQEIVLETLTELEQDKSQMEAVIEKAKEIQESGAELSKTALKQSLQRVVEDLDELRPLLKLRRLHWALGCQNLKILLQDKSFRAELDRIGINYAKFEQASV